MAQPAQQQQQRRRAAAAGAAAAGAAAAGAAVAAAPPAAAAGAGVGLGVTTAAILSAFVSFLAQLREQHRSWLTENLGRYSSQPDDITATILEEMRREEAFARNSADRVASALPQALRIDDPREREARIRRILSDEERYAAQRAEAMVARAIAAVERMALRRSSPLGAFWRIGVAKDHTEGCRFMAGWPGREGRFWPWAVLDRVHPPRHYGCTSGLHSYGDAVLNGWMSPSDVPDARAAVRAAAGVVMEREDADAVLAELDVRDQLLELGIDTAGIPFAGVTEAFDAGKHPRGFHGRFRSVADVAAALRRGEAAEIAPAKLPALIDELDGEEQSAFHRLQVTGHPNLFRAHARELSRDEMPQIPKAHLPGFMDFLRSKRVGATVERVAPSSLQATQNQLSGAGVAEMAKRWDPSRQGMLMISREGHVLDGHHRWGASAVHELANPGYKIDVLRFAASTDRILRLMHEYNDLAGVQRRAFGQKAEAA